MREGLTPPGLIWEGRVCASRRRRRRVSRSVKKQPGRRNSGRATSSAFAPGTEALGRRAKPETAWLLLNLEEEGVVAPAGIPVSLGIALLGFSAYALRDLR